MAADDIGAGRYQVTIGDIAVTVTAVIDTDAVYLHGPFGNADFSIDPYLAHASVGGRDSGRLLAPMMGQIIKVNVSKGDAVKAGDVLLVQESMKMEFRLTAPFDGVVVELAGREGDMVERNTLVAEISAAGATETTQQQ